MDSGIFTHKKYYQDKLEYLILRLTSINEVCAAFGSRKESGENDVFLVVYVFGGGM